MPKNAIAFALDYPTTNQALVTLQRIHPYVGFAKIGLELFTREGPASVGQVLDAGFKVFLDLKLHDIPETVERAVANACTLGASLLTLHLSGGPAMIEKAINRAAKENPQMQLVGVTVLTSLDRSDLEAVGVSGSVPVQVLRLAKIAWEVGLRAFVCSPQETALLRTILGPSAFLVTPGIRPSGIEVQDQKRVATPSAAIRDGSNLLVIGRPIRDAVHPAKVAGEILGEVMASRVGSKKYDESI